MFRTMRAFWLANAEASRGGSTLELPGVAAAIFPSMPERSVVNCVVYYEAEALGAALDQLAAAYDEAGGVAWTGLGHDSDARAQELLTAAGKVVGAEPMAPARDLGG